MKMREIKFRGKRIDNGEWVYGNYFIDERDIEDGFIWRDISQIQQRYGDHYQYYDVDPSTVGQYTGLKDKHGKEIYEGDIMGFHAYGYYYIGVVQYSNAGAAFGVKCETASETETWPYLDVAINNHRAVKIGNIHDNPELLKT
jgi:uncharacterized phage protein (TIGR01671 family)